MNRFDQDMAVGRGRPARRRRPARRVGDHSQAIDGLADRLDHGRKAEVAVALEELVRLRSDASA